MCGGKLKASACVWAWFAMVAGCGDGPRFQNGSTLARSTENLEANPGYADSFQVATFQNRNLSWDSSSSEVRDSLSLVKGPLQITGFNQVERTLYQDTFVQGGDGALVNQSMPIKEAGHLDLLLVIDNSASMNVHQDKLAPRLGSILSNISNTNWRIAAVTTDNPCVRDVITRSEFEQDNGSALARFASAVTPGAGGSNWERGIQMAIEGFSARACATTSNGFANNQWTRSDSAKVVLILSDEDNCGSASNEGICSNGGIPPYPNIGPDDFMAIGPQGAKVFGIVPTFDPADPKCDPELGWEHPSTLVPPLTERYIDLINRTGGKYTSICSADYSAILTAMSADVGNIIHRNFILSAVPDVGSLQVRVDGVSLNSGFTVTGNAVDVEGSAISASNISIEFNYVAGTAVRTNTLALSESPDPGTFEIMIENQGVGPDKFTYDGQQNALVFNPWPDDRKTVMARYRASGALPSSFSMPVGAATAGLKVRVGGTDLSGDQFSTETPEQVTLGSAPRDGAAIQFSYFMADAMQTTYPLDPSIAPYSTSVVVTAEGEKLTSALIREADVSLDPDDVARLSEISIVYSFLNPEEFSRVTFPEKPVHMQWQLGVDQRSDLQCESIGTSGSVVDLSCYVKKYKSFSVNYASVIQRTNQFELTRKVTNPASIVVSVDGKAQNNFSFEGQKITIDPSVLSDESVVTVRYQ